MDVKKILKDDEEDQNLPDETTVEETAATPPPGEGERAGDDEAPAEGGESPEVELSPLEMSEAKAQEYLVGWQRSRAEFANYKRRIAREREQIHQVSKAKVILDYLDILDDLERALNNRPQTGEGATWAEGIELIYKKLESKLEAAGVEAMNAEGQKFDPNLHEALMQEESDEHKSDCITEVVQTGYLLGERVLRPAQVRIAA
ncbi:MAG: Protein GrpE [Chloroflexi bacterium]|nr:Protein GrpE [Chloroflexota bacterium]